MVGLFFRFVFACFRRLTGGGEVLARIQILKRKKTLAYVYIFDVASVCTQVPTER